MVTYIVFGRVRDGLDCSRPRVLEEIEMMYLSNLGVCTPHMNVLFVVRDEHSTSRLS